MALSEDDPVTRIVDTAVEAQTRLMLAYMEQMRQKMRHEIIAVVRVEFAGDQFYVGKAGCSRLAERNAAIRIDRESGLSIRALSRKWHLSKSQVCDVLNGQVSGVSVKDRTAEVKNGNRATSPEGR